jgi:cell division protein FtsN
MPKKKPSTTKKYNISLSATALFFWSVAFVVVLAWIFALGIFVGRDRIPENVQNLVTLRTPEKASVGTKDNNPSPPLEIIDPIRKDPEFAFYDELTSTRKKTTTTEDATPKVIQPKIVQEPSPAPAEKAKGKYTVQVASLEDDGKAHHMVNQLGTKGYAAYTQKATIGGKTYYRVRCGTFETREKAGELQKRLAEKEGLKGFVTGTD